MFESGLGCDVGFALAGFDETAASDGDLLAALAESARGITWLQARQAELVAEVSRRRPESTPPPGMSPLQPAADEVAAVLRISTTAAMQRVQNCAALTGRERRTLDALRAGMLAERTAFAIVEAVAPLPDDAAVEVERRALRRADGQTPAQTRAVLRRALLSVDPRSREERRATACEQRGVWITPLDDGMAELRAVLAAADAVRVGESLDAATVVTGAATSDQRRADALVALVTGESVPSRPTQVSVTVSAGSLLGVAEEPGHLGGFGPIPAELARQLAADGLWRRILTDPVDGSVLDVGRRRYRPPAEMDRLVRIRDGHCRFPGCRRRADRGDVDHVVPFPDGPTSVVNLQSLCRRHHRLKHEAGWQVRSLDNGRMEWTSPMGAVHITDPAGPEGEGRWSSSIGPPEDWLAATFGDLPPPDWSEPEPAEF